MYGTVASFRAKAGNEDKLRAVTSSYEALKIPGHVSTWVYRLDEGDNKYLMAVAFTDKESYVRNASDPAQDARFRELASLLDGDIQWSDGEIIYAMQ